MAIYIVDGKEQTVPKEEMAAFEKANPTAQVRIYHNGKSADVPLGVRDSAAAGGRDIVYESDPVLASMDEKEGRANTAKQAPIAKPHSVGGAAGTAGMPITGWASDFSEAPKEPESQPKQTSEAQTIIPAPYNNEVVKEIDKELAPEIEALQEQAGHKLNPVKGVEFKTVGKRDTYTPMYTPTIEQAIEDEAQSKSVQGQVIAQMGNIQRLRKANQREPILVAPGQYLPTSGQAELNAAESILTDVAAKDADYRKFMSGDTRNMGNLWRGFKTGVLDADTWLMGIESLYEGAQIKRAIERLEAGQPLTAAENALLDAAALDFVQKAEMQHSMDGWYRAGEVTAQAVPFMAEMAINPASGLGRAFAKRVGKAAIQRMGKGATRLAAGVAEQVGNVAGATLMGVMSPATYADALERMRGDLPVVRDDEGNIVYNEGGKRTDGDSAGEAFGKAVGSAAIERYSEMFGNILGRGAGAFAKATGLNRILPKGNIAGSIADLIKSTQFHGIVGESIEEVVGGALNAALIGDTSWDDMKSPQYYKDIVGGLLPMSIAFGTLGAASYRTPRRIAKNQVQQAREVLLNMGLNPEEFRSAANTQAQAMSFFDRLGKDSSLNGVQKNAIAKYVAAEIAFKEANETTPNISEEDKAFGDELATEYEVGEAAVDQSLGGDASAEDAIIEEYRNARADLASVDGVNLDEIDALANAGMYEYFRNNSAHARPIWDYLRKRQRHIAIAQTRQALADIADIGNDVEAARQTGTQIGAVNFEEAASQGMQRRDESMAELSNNEIEALDRDGVKAIRGVANKQAAAQYLESQAYLEGAHQSAQEQAETVAGQAANDVAIRAAEDGQVYTVRTRGGDTYNIIQGQIVANPDGSINTAESSKYLTVVESANPQGKRMMIAPKDIAAIEGVANAEEAATAAAEQARQAYLAQVEAAFNVATEAQVQRQEAQRTEAARQQAESQLRAGSNIAVTIGGAPFSATIESIDNGVAVVNFGRSVMLGGKARQVHSIPVNELAQIATTELQPQSQQEQTAGEKQIPSEVDYDEMLARNPQEFLDAYEAEVGREVAQGFMQNLIANTRKAIEQKRKAMEKEFASPNKYVALKREADALESRLALYEAVYDEKYNAPQDTAEQETSSESPEVAEQQKPNVINNTIQLSDEIDANGRQFVLSPSGDIAFGFVTDDTGLTPAPILLSEGMITNPATNDGYGLAHIEARHGAQIRQAGYPSVIDFINEVAKNYETIREGNKRGDQQTYMLQLTDKHNNTLMVELSGDGTYWNINTAGVFKTSYGKNKKVVYNRQTTGKQFAETVGVSQGAEQSGTQTPSSLIDTPTPNVISDNKDNASNAENQISEQENISPIEDKISEWSKKLGVPVNVYHTFDEIPNAQARDAINAGQRVRGWYEPSTGAVAFYMPNLNSEAEVDEVFAHEVVAHKGLRGLLGQEKFDALCDKVWDMMSEADREFYANYPGVNGDKRAAADEYMAHLAEKVDLTEEERTIWQSIVDFIQQVLRDVKANLTNADIEDLIRLSYREMTESAQAQQAQVNKLTDAEVDVSNQEKDTTSSEENKTPSKETRKEKEEPNVVVGAQGRRELYERILKEQGVFKPIKSTAKYRLSNYLKNDPLRPALGVIHNEHGYAVATDSFVLVADKNAYNPELDGATLDKNGNVVESGVKLNWKAIGVPENKNPLGVDLDNLLSFIAGVKAEYKKGWEALKSMGQQVGSFERFLSDKQVMLPLPNGDAITTSLSRLEKFVVAAKHLGATDIYGAAYDKVLGVNTPNGYTMLMPLKDATSELANIRAYAEPNARLKQPKTRAKETQKIEDYGEKIAGARKDVLKNISKNFDNATIESLIALPFAKAFIKPDLKKLVEAGVLRPNDAKYAEAIMWVFINKNKPKARKTDVYLAKRGRENRITEWAKKTYEGITRLREFIEADIATRDELIAKYGKLGEQIKAEEDAYRNSKIGQFNAAANGYGDLYSPNPIEVIVAALDKLNYQAGDKVVFDAPIVKAEYLGRYFNFENQDGEKVYAFNRVDNIEDAINTLVLQAKIRRGDTDIQYPLYMFSVTREDPIREPSGKFTVYHFNRRGSVASEVVDSKEAAEKMVADFKAKGSDAQYREETKIVGYSTHRIRFKNRLTDVETIFDEKFGSEAEARQALENRYDEFNDLANDYVASLSNKKREEVLPFEVAPSWTSETRTVKYIVKNTDTGDVMSPRFDTRKDAEEYFKKHIDEWGAKWREMKEARKKFVYFDDNVSPRKGPDYRQGRDVTPEDLASTFGFRGIQFGNWTNDADRQAALNQAYDAFMDLADIIGVSPRAISLAGELGIAFGARGGGSANAHYEPTEVVINLTKTRGAGSLAHEWWHALDNYFSRQGNVALGFVTTNPAEAKMREEMRKAWQGVVNTIKGTDYAKRSMAQGDYWGRMLEMTARLFAEWTVYELAKTGRTNHFLSRGVTPQTFDMMRRINYAAYKWSLPENEIPMPFEEFAKLPRSIKGMPFPTKEETEQMGDAVRNLFDIMEERIDEQGKAILFSITSMSPEQIEQGVASANRKQKQPGRTLQSQKNNITLSNYGEGFEQNNDEQRQADGSRVVEDTTREVLGGSDRGDIRVFEEGLGTSFNEHSKYSERTRRDKESERLVDIAKRHDLFIPIGQTKLLGRRHGKRTGESTVYINEEAGKVFKVKNPYAKSAIKGGVLPEDAIFEHIIHNLLFPETAYTFEGISEELGDVRIVLSQDYIQNYKQPTQQQIVDALATRGLVAEDKYSFGNNLVSVTDVEGDNALLGENGEVFFIDPIINFKKPAREIIEELSGDNDIRFSIGRNRQEQMYNTLGKRRADLTDQEKKAVIAELDKIDDNKVVNAAFHYFVNGTIRIPEDMPKVEQAVKVASIAKIDPASFRSPMELIEAHADIKIKDKRIDPDTVSTLSNKVEYGKGIAVYDVEDSQESRENMRKIINTHFGEESSPWCLLQGDGNGNLTEQSQKYWEHYNAYPKRVAFKDGKLLAFFASDDRPIWWDRQDDAHDGIPITEKLPDGSGRIGVVEYYEEDGFWGDYTDIHLGERGGDLYEEWESESELSLREIKKDGTIYSYSYDSGALIKYTEKDAETYRTQRSVTLDFEGNVAAVLEKNGTEYEFQQNAVGKPRRVFFNKTNGVINWCYNGTFAALSDDNNIVRVDRDGDYDRVETYGKDGEVLLNVSYAAGGRMSTGSMLEDDGTRTYCSWWGSRLKQFREGGEAAFLEGDEVLESTEGWDDKTAVQLRVMAEQARKRIESKVEEKVQWAKAVAEHWAEEAQKVFERATAFVESIDTGRTGEVRFSIAPTPTEATAAVAESYNNRVASVSAKFRENLFDVNNSVQILQDEIERATGEPIADFENIYLHQNHRNSRAREELSYYTNHFHQRILDVVSNLLRRGVAYNDITKYLMAKHGLERNDMMSWRKAVKDAAKRKRQQALKDWEVSKAAAKALGVSEPRNMVKSVAEYEQEYLNRYYEAIKGLTAEEYQERRRKIMDSIVPFNEKYHEDYSGLTELFGYDAKNDAKKVDEIATAAIEYVANFERNNSWAVQSLWEAVRSANGYSVQKALDTGLIGADRFDAMNSMYRYYVPLRGWANNKADEVFDYVDVSSAGAFNKLSQTAKGRKSQAEDPIAVMYNIAASTILQGSKNRANMPLLNLARNRQTDLLTVSQLWEVKNSDTDEWEVQPINLAQFSSTNEYSEEALRRANENSANVAQAVREYEERMRELEAQGKARPVRSGLTLGTLHTTGNQAKQHGVQVWVGGVPMIVWINGNPRAAQALNGLLSKPYGKELQRVKNLLSQWSGLATANNPEFWISNGFRDFGYSRFNLRNKYGWKYYTQYEKNYWKAFSSLWKMMDNYERKAFESEGVQPELQAYWNEYVRNGAATGYAYVKSVEEAKVDIQKQLKKMNGKKINTARDWEVLMDSIGYVGSAIETIPRFAAYVTSRQQGKSILESVADAKEATTNFDRKGGRWNRAGSLFWAFFNASLQGLDNFIQVVKKNPKGALLELGVRAGMGSAGLLLFNLALGAMYGDDPDEVEEQYWSLSDFVRRNNMCLYLGDAGWVKIPLAQNLRIFYSVGDIVSKAVRGQSTYDNVGMDIISAILDILPLNLVGSENPWNALSPTLVAPFADIASNKDFAGRTIANQHFFNELDPEWQRTFGDEPEIYVVISKLLSEISGGDKHKRGWWEWNPAYMSHIVESWLAGVGTLGTKFWQSGQTAYGNAKEIASGGSYINPYRFKWNNTPFLRRLVQDPLGDVSNTKINQAFAYWDEQYAAWQREMRGYASDEEGGEYVDPKVWDRLLEVEPAMEWFKQAKKDIKELYELRDETSNPDEIAQINVEIAQLKRDAVMLMEDVTGKGKRDK